MVNEVNENIEHLEYQLLLACCQAVFMKKNLKIIQGDMNELLNSKTLQKKMY